MQKITPEWLKEQLDKKRGARTRLAERLGVGTDVVSKMVAGTRRPQAEEIPVILDFFGLELDVDQEFQGIWNALSGEGHQTLKSVAKALLERERAAHQDSDETTE
ncbi:helix-turn-helix domain-containing protein [Mameliella alba]|uniref:helix-turn-helix domain-containing protein n=1 Tax=Mameliella alba TaxID=561184 RepID=UPI0005BBB0AF|nr:helix-turn-helix transcriptional regulator [Mameliella alba]